MRLSCLLTGVLLFSSALAARADATTYDISGAGLLTGTVSINSMRGTITSSDLTVVTPSFTEELFGAGGDGVGRTGFELLYFTSNDSYQLLLTSPNSDGTLRGFSGGSFFFSDALGMADTSGTLVAAAVPTSITPEPGSLWLLGTGMVGVVGLVRRRLGAPAD